MLSLVKLTFLWTCYSKIVRWTAFPYPTNLWELLVSSYSGVKKGGGGRIKYQVDELLNYCINGRGT